VDDDDVFFVSSAQKQSNARRSTTHTMSTRARSTAKRKASGSMFLLHYFYDVLLNGIISGISSTTEYTSAYRPRKIPSAPPSQLEFDMYEFDKTTLTIDDGGNIDEVVTLDEKIEIAKTWRQFVADGKPDGGYLSKGATKYAFIVCVTLSSVHLLDSIGSCKYRVVSTKLCMLYSSAG
jgi:hypothetical protein